MNYHKYLKYKIRYLSLKTQFGGSIIKIEINMDGSKLDIQLSLEHLFIHGLKSLISQRLRIPVENIELSDGTNKITNDRQLQEVIKRETNDFNNLREIVKLTLVKVEYTEEAKIINDIKTARPNEIYRIIKSYIDKNLKQEMNDYQKANFLKKFESVLNAIYFRCLKPKETRGQFFDFLYNRSKELIRSILEKFNNILKEFPTLLELMVRFDIDILKDAKFQFIIQKAFFISLIDDAYHRDLLSFLKEEFKTDKEILSAIFKNESFLKIINYKLILSTFPIIETDIEIFRIAIASICGFAFVTPTTFEKMKKCNS